MGCSTSKLEPEDQLEMEAAPSKPATRRGFASDLFGRARKSSNVRKSSGSDAATAGGRQQQQQEEEEEEEQRPQQGRKDEADGGGGRELARSPGSPSFRYYCENASAFAVAESKKERR